MRFALLGADPETLALAEAGLRCGHQLAIACDIAAEEETLRRLAPAARLGAPWENLLHGDVAELVLVAATPRDSAAAERRYEQLRKLAQAGVPVLATAPACPSLLGYELEMIRRDRQGLLLNYVPGARHPGWQKLAELLEGGSASPLGAVEQIIVERALVDRSPPAVLAQFTRDAALLRRLLGQLRSVSAVGGGGDAHDPLAPTRPALSLGAITVHLAGTGSLQARWSVAPALAGEQGTFTLQGERGQARLRLVGPPVDWTLETALPGEPERAERFTQGPDAQDGPAVWRAVAEELAGQSRFPPWIEACRDAEAAEAIEPSLARRRAIPLVTEEPTEQESFRGLMAAGGCLVLILALLAVLAIGVVEGLRLPIRDWALFRLWPVGLLALIVVFLLAQALQVVAKK